MMFHLELSFSLTSNTQYNKLITISSYVLLSYSALNFPIHTLRLLHSRFPASALTLSDFSTNTLTPQLILTVLASLCLFFFAPPRVCSANTRGQGHVGLFYETIPLKDRRHIDGPYGA